MRFNKTNSFILINFLYTSNLVLSPLFLSLFSAWDHQPSPSVKWRDEIKVNLTTNYLYTQTHTLNFKPTPKHTRDCRRLTRVKNEEWRREKKATRFIICNLHPYDGIQCKYSNVPTLQYDALRWSLYSLYHLIFIRLTWK